MKTHLKRFAVLLAFTLHLSPFTLQVRAADDQSTIDALQLLAANPEIDTDQLIQIALQAFPEMTLTQLLTLVTGEPLPDWTGPTGFEPVDSFVDSTAPDLAAPDSTAPISIQLADLTAPDLSLSQIVQQLAIASQRFALVDDSDQLAQVLIAAGVRALPTPQRWSALGIQWHEAVQAQDYARMGELAAKIDAADKRREAIQN